MEEEHRATIQLGRVWEQLIQERLAVVSKEQLAAGYMEAKVFRMQELVHSVKIWVLHEALDQR